MENIFSGYNKTLLHRKMLDRAKKIIPSAS